MGICFDYLVSSAKYQRETKSAVMHYSVPRFLHVCFILKNTKKVEKCSSVGKAFPPKGSVLSKPSTQEELSTRNCVIFLKIMLFFAVCYQKIRKNEINVSKICMTNILPCSSSNDQARTFTFLQGSEDRPMVVLFGWAGAKHKHLDKYAQIYR